MPNKPAVKLKTVKIGEKDYVMVDTRVKEFHRLYPNGMIETKLISYTEGVVVFKAKAIPDVAKPDRYFTGYSQERIGEGMINKTSALENGETSAVGRALGFAGIGIVEGIASADEINKAINADKSWNEKPWMSDNIFQGLMERVQNGYADDAQKEMQKYRLKNKYKDELNEAIKNIKSKSPEEIKNIQNGEIPF